MSAAEYEHIENKLSLGEKHEATVAVAAFATARGGTVRFGIASDGRRIGVQLGRTTLEELANYIRQSTDPPQFPSIIVEGEETSAVVNVHVEESPIKPVWAFGKPYKRVGRTNQSLSREETQRLVDMTTGRTWDALPCAGLRLDHLQRPLIAAYLRRVEQDIESTTESVLENLGLRTPEGLCNGAALLFTDNPDRFFPEAQVKCARFRGTSSVEFLDERTIYGSVLTQLEESLAFVARNIRQGIRITGRPEREIVPEYPDAAVREAITNAICHRDYAASGTVQVRIYEDRLEVWNPGALPPDLPIEQLYLSHSSHPRNRKLAGAFYRARLIEHWGTGTLRIVQACEQHGMPRPEFLYEMGMFIVRFWPSLSGGTVSELAGLNERQKQVIAYIREHGAITRARYKEVFEVSERQASRDLDALVQLGLFVREGLGPATRYLSAEAK